MAMLKIRYGRRGIRSFFNAFRIGPFWFGFPFRLW